ncbi:MAG: carboxypeptidase-like regulatory domain-containing protein [Gemmatimonadaceae bacterium]|nr:carboxypeptidase-like regulatory domain-containing protein [Gemmatimonadaceae bacterium]
MPALSPPSGAQAPVAGQITGLVLDSPSGRPLTAVQVFVAGTRLGGSTNDAGRFIIGNVPAGSVGLETRRVGYRGGRLPNVNVAAGGTPEVEFRPPSRSEDTPHAAPGPAIARRTWPAAPGQRSAEHLQIRSGGFRAHGGTSTSCCA